MLTPLLRNFGARHDRVADRAGVELDCRQGLIGQDSRDLVAAERVKADRPGDRIWAGKRGGAAGPVGAGALLGDRSYVIQNRSLISHLVIQSHEVIDDVFGIERAEILLHLLEIAIDETVIGVARHTERSDRAPRRLL